MPHGRDRAFVQYILLFGWSGRREWGMGESALDSVSKQDPRLRFGLALRPRGDSDESVADYL